MHTIFASYWNWARAIVKSAQLLLFPCFLWLVTRILLDILFWSRFWWRSCLSNLLENMNHVDALFVRLFSLSWCPFDEVLLLLKNTPGYFIFSERESWSRKVKIHLLVRWNRNSQFNQQFNKFPAELVSPLSRVLTVPILDCVSN
jgi:hypothetical protein